MMRPRRSHFDMCFQVKSICELNQFSDTESGNLSLEQVTHVRLMSLQFPHEVSLAQSALLDISHECPPDVRLDLNFQGFLGGKAQIIEHIALGDMGGRGAILPCAFHFFAPLECAAERLINGFALFSGLCVLSWLCPSQNNARHK